jgi:hypothetical protein
MKIIKKILCELLGHKWGYEEKLGIKKEKKNCERCGIDRCQTEGHDWNIYSISSSYRYRTCNRCSYEEDKFTEKAR